MSSPSGSSIATEAEIAAALKEAEAEAARIPNLDEAAVESVVPIPVAAIPRPQSKSRSERTAQRADASTAAVAGDAGVAAASQSQSAATSDGFEPGVIWRALDTVLWLLNRPFDWLDPQARRILGYLAIVTIVVSLTASFLLPTLFPPRDPVSQLARQCAAVRAAQAQSAGGQEH